VRRTKPRRPIGGPPASSKRATSAHSERRPAACARAFKEPSYAAWLRRQRCCCPLWLARLKFAPGVAPWSMGPSPSQLSILLCCAPHSPLQPWHVNVHERVVGACVSTQSVSHGPAAAPVLALPALRKQQLAQEVSAARSTFLASLSHTRAGRNSDPRARYQGIFSGQGTHASGGSLARPSSPSSPPADRDKNSFRSSTPSTF